MKRVAGLVALLLLAGCAAPVGVAAPAAPVAPASPAPSGAIQVRPESMLKLPLGTVVDLDLGTVTVLADEGIRTRAGRSVWAFRVNMCVAAGAMEWRPSALAAWRATTESGMSVNAVPVTGTDEYGTVLRPGECREGSVYFASGAHPARVWYQSNVVGWLGWATAG